MLLEEEYKAGARELTKSGNNGEVFDIALPRTKACIYTADDEAKI